MGDRSRRRTGIAASLLLAAATLLAACNGSGDKASLSEGRFERAPQATGGAGAADVSGSAESPALVDLAAAKRPAEREVIYTASLEVGAKNVERAAAAARRVAGGAGGYLFSSEETGLDGDPSVTLTFKVPPDRFEGVLDALGRLGKVSERQVDTEDVTGQVVDLDARLAAARTSAERLRELLTQAANVGDLLNVEREMASREAQVESLDGRLAALREQVDLATITLRLVEPSEAKPEVSKRIPGFVKGLKTGAAAFVNALLVIATALGLALPFLAAAVVLGVPALWVARRRRRTAPPPA